MVPATYRNYITFLTSHKRTPLPSGHIFWSQGCPLTEGSTVQLKRHGNKQLYLENWKQKLSKTNRISLNSSFITCGIQSTLGLRTPRYYRHPLLRTKSSTTSGEIYRGLTENDSRYCGLSLLRSSNYVPRASAITIVDSISKSQYVSWAKQHRRFLPINLRRRRLDW